MNRLDMRLMFRPMAGLGVALALLAVPAALADGGIEPGDLLHESERLEVRLLDVSRVEDRSSRFDITFEVIVKDREAVHEVTAEEVRAAPEWLEVRILEAADHAVFVLHSRNVAGNMFRTVVVAELDTGAVVDELKANDPSLSPDGRLMAFASPIFGGRRRPVNQQIHIYDFSQATAESLEPAHMPVHTVFSSSSGLTADGEERELFHLLRGPLAWAPDGGWLVTLLGRSGGGHRDQILVVVEDPASQEPTVRKRTVPVEEEMYREDRRDRYFGPDATREPLEGFTVESFEWIDATRITARLEQPPFGMLKEELVLELP